MLALVEQLVTETPNAKWQRQMLRQLQSGICSSFDYSRKDRVTEWYLRLLARLGANQDLAPPPTLLELPPGKAMARL